MASDSIDIQPEPTKEFLKESEYMRQPAVEEALMSGNLESLKGLEACVNCSKSWCRWVKKEDFGRFGFPDDAEHTFEHIEYCETADEPFRTYPDAKCNKRRPGQMARP